MKKLLVVLAILFVGILLAGCTSQPATPVATPTPTPAPTTIVTTVVPTEVPTVVPTMNVTPNATPTVTPTATATPRPTVMISFNQAGTITPGTTVTIPVGTTVVWKNNDQFKPHAVIAIDVVAGAYFGSMNTVEIPYGKTFNVTFDKVGAYNYATVYQPATTGIIKVVAK